MKETVWLYLPDGFARPGFEKSLPCGVFETKRSGIDPRAALALVAETASRKHSLQVCGIMAGGACLPRIHLAGSRLDSLSFSPGEPRLILNLAAKAIHIRFSRSGSISPQRYSRSLRRKYRQTRRKACNWRLMP